MQRIGPPQIRIIGALVALVLLVPLLTARQLSPDPDGLGTHQQLGLPPCSMRFLFGIRCPACGMTTSWSHFTRGDLVASVRSNAGGAGLAVVAVLTIGLGLGSVGTGRWPSRFAQKWVSVALVAAAAVTLTDWSFRLFG